LWGSPPASFSIWLATPPDLLVGDDGKLIAVRGTDGRLLLSSKRAGRFDAELWLRRDGQAERLDWDDAASQADSGPAMRCARLPPPARKRPLGGASRIPAALAEAAERIASQPAVGLRRSIIPVEPLRLAVAPQPELGVEPPGRFDESSNRPSVPRTAISLPSSPTRSRAASPARC